MINIHYQGIVKIAGHSCPTVAGAYLLTQKALDALYGDATPLRGGVKVSFDSSMEEGTTGVVANVISNITGATDKSGFKGLKGNFARHSLMQFSDPEVKGIKFTRVDTNESVTLSYHPEVVPPKEEQMQLMQKIMQKSATKEEQTAFSLLWQERVEQILLHHYNDPELVKIS